VSKIDFSIIELYKSLSFGMDPNEYLNARKKSFGYAFKGIATLFTTQPHAKIHAIATVSVIILGLLLSISIAQWAIISLAIGMVWVAEGMNTAIEFVVDLASPDYHELAGKAKDVAAGAVLIAAFIAIVCGLLIFIPKIWDLFF
jgi:diacylglycerol kinase (ATP)